MANSVAERKRRQRERRKQAGLHRIEIALGTQALARLDRICAEMLLTRSEVVDRALADRLEVEIRDYQTEQHQAGKARPTS